MEIGRLLLVVGETAGELLLAARARLCLMFGEGFVVTFDVDRKPLFARHLLRDLHGEAVSVVQVEGGYAVDYIARRLGRGDFFELLQALCERFGELSLFLVELFLYLCSVLYELGIDVGIFFDYCL